MIHKVKINKIRPSAMAQKDANRRLVHIMAEHGKGFIASVESIPNLCELAEEVVQKDWSVAVSLGLGDEKHKIIRALWAMCRPVERRILFETDDEEEAYREERNQMAIHERASLANKRCPGDPMANENYKTLLVRKTTHRKARQLAAKYEIEIRDVIDRALMALEAVDSLPSQMFPADTKPNKERP